MKIRSKTTLALMFVSLLQGNTSSGEETLLENHAQQQGTNPYKMKKYSISNGGGTIVGGSYQLRSTIGQLDASNYITGGAYSLNGGFINANNNLIFKNNFE